MSLRLFTVCHSNVLVGLLPVVEPEQIHSEQEFLIDQLWVHIQTQSRMVITLFRHYLSVYFKLYFFYSSCSNDGVIVFHQGYEHIEKDLKIPKGQSESVYRRRTDNTVVKRKKVHKDKQRSTKHTYKPKDRVTRTQLKIGGEFRCSGRISSSLMPSLNLRLMVSWFTMNNYCFMPQPLSSVIKLGVNSPPN